uniref:PABC domain-containing protein n=1 Tax=Eptatretus burgeri TaxID=7764 RepID=A0A8C4QYV9_EPTBU
MLLELGEGEVRRMLREPSWLDRRLDQATAALQSADDPAGLSFNTNLKSLKWTFLFTGMLLELDPPALQAVLADPTSLREAVQKAKEALVVARHSGNNHKQTMLLTADGRPHEQPYQDNDKASDVYESTGEQLFDYLLTTKYAQHAAQITGMLLEMPLSDLRTLVQLPKQLNEKIILAAQALGEES